MSFDGFITKSIVTELSNVLTEAKVNKVFQPTKTDVILGLYNNGVNYALNLCTNPDFCRINLTTHQKPNPQNAYNFCMLLRKYLIGGKIKKISNYDLERTVEIKFECYNELNDLVIRKLFIEIMSRQSNIILTNENNIIIDTLRHTDTQTRELLPAHKYEFTPINKNSFLEIQDVDEFISFIYSVENMSLAKIIYSNFIGFSKTFTRETLKHLEIDEFNFSREDINKLYNYLKQLVSNLGTSKVYCKKTDDDKDYCLFINNRAVENQNSKYLDTNWFIDDYYIAKEQTTLFINSRNNLLRVVSTSLNKVYKKLENINNKLKTCEDREKYRLYGELLTANLYRFDNNAITNEVVVNNYYDNNKEITIPLDTRVSIQKNVEKYYKKYNKLKNTLDICSIQKKETEKELDYISSIVFNLKNARNLNDISGVYDEIKENVLTKKELTKNKPSSHNNQEDKIKIENITIDNYTIYIGKNNIQNDYLSLKFANSNDIWFHVQKMHGSHVLLRNSDNQEIDEIPENILYSCSKLAKENSKASSSLNVPVDYCYARYVKKVSGSKPGMVIYNNFKTIIVK